MGALLRLVRAHRQAQAEEVALSGMSYADLFVLLARRLAELPPAVDHAGFIAIARVLAVHRSGPPDIWPSEAAELLRGAAIGEFSEGDLRDVERNAAYAKFRTLFEAEHPVIGPDCTGFAEWVHCLRESMIEAGS
jgi:hypothetical protein